jgi:hypothetical protein
MKRTKSKEPKITKIVPVMYQNLQGNWYAFAEFDGELYFAKVPLKVAVEKNDQEAIKEIQKNPKQA